MSHSSDRTYPRYLGWCAGCDGTVEIATVRAHAGAFPQRRCADQAHPVDSTGWHVVAAGEPRDFDINESAR